MAEITDQDMFDAFYGDDGLPAGISPPSVLFEQQRTADQPLVCTSCWREIGVGERYLRSRVITAAGFAAVIYRKCLRCAGSRP